MSKKKPEPPKPWSLTQADLESITKQEALLGTVRLLPPVGEIPKEFWGTNIYVRIVESMYSGDNPPAGAVHFHPGFTGLNMQPCIMAHLKSFEPDYDHKIAGVAYMIYKIVHVTAILNK